MGNNSREEDPAASYRVEFTGCLPRDWADWFDGMAIAENISTRNTVLVGPIADQAALNGLINKIYALGLSLVAVNPRIAPFESCVAFTTEEIRQKYNADGRAYRSRERIDELLGLRKLRRKLLRNAAGNVLEVAIGTGVNLPYYPPGCVITAVDVSETMLAMAREKARTLGLQVTFLTASIEALTLPAGSFDSVVSTLSTCTFPDPVGALREMARLCRPGGRILLLEHGRSDHEWLGRYQDRKLAHHSQRLGCIWNREPLQIVQAAGLKIVTHKRFFFGVFHIFEAQPKDVAP